MQATGIELRSTNKFRHVWPVDCTQERQVHSRKVSATNSAGTTGFSKAKE